jgi:carbon storage regulator
MLVLTRRIGEEIVVAGNIRIKVLVLKGNQVRLGIEAPASVTVVREELLALSANHINTTELLPSIAPVKSV